MGFAGRAWLGASLAVALAACFIDNPGAAPPAGTTSTSGAGGHDAGVTTSTGGAGGAGGAAPTMCTRNGGYVTIEAVVSDLLSRLTADCDISAFFTALPPAARQHLSDCLFKQLAVMTHCPLIKYDVDSSGADCRDMKTSHHGLGIRQGDYDVFVKHLKGSFQSAGFSQADIAALTPPIDFYSADIVTNSAPGLDKSLCDAGGGG